jgi:hypothetical protein
LSSEAVPKQPGFGTASSVSFLPILARLRLKKLYAIGLKFVVKYKLGKNDTLDKKFLNDYHNTIWKI